MDKFLTIEVDQVSNTKRQLKVGFLCAANTLEAYEQMEISHPKEHDETLVIKQSEVNQLIIDLNKTARKM